MSVPPTPPLLLYFGKAPSSQTELKCYKHLSPQMCSLKAGALLFIPAFREIFFSFFYYPARPSSQAVHYGLSLTLMPPRLHPEASSVLPQAHGAHHHSPPARQTPPPPLGSELTWSLQGPAEPVTVPKPFCPHHELCRGGVSAAGGVQPVQQTPSALAQAARSPPPP